MTVATSHAVAGGLQPLSGADQEGNGASQGPGKVARTAVTCGYAAQRDPENGVKQ